MVGTSGSGCRSIVRHTGTGRPPRMSPRSLVPAELLKGYHAAVHRATLGYVDGITAAELGRIVDTRWDPPVTAAVRTVSVIGDCLQHLGQAAYVRGLAERSSRRG